MSTVVDKYLYETMQKADHIDLLSGQPLGEMVLDHMCGYDTESGLFDPDAGMMFPQPTKEV